MGYKVAYFSMPKLLQKLQFARADGSIFKELAKLEKVNLLILDDWGDRRSDYKLLKLLPNFHYCNSLRIDMVEIQRLLHPNYPWLNGLTISMNQHWVKLKERTKIVAGLAEFLSLIIIMAV